MCRLIEEYILSVLRSIIKEKSSNVAMLFRNGLSGRQINNFTFRGNLYSTQTLDTNQTNQTCSNGEGEGDGIHGTECEQ